MKRVAWLTDIHLNFLTPEQVAAFFDDVRAAEADAVLIGGDIGESHDVVGYLERIDDALGLPIYFVLGNHDYYFGSIASVRERIVRLCAERPRLHYLTRGGVEQLSPGVGLVGDDGWADARLGDYERSLVSMYDYKLIDDLAGRTKLERLPVLRRLGDEAAEHLTGVLPEAVAKYPQVLLLMHVPPLREACWHEGQTSDDQWAPHFTCKAVGDVILRTMSEHPDRRLIVLCGHTHGAGECWPLPNVQILTGGAQYGHPAVQRVFEFP